jgi:hypothetical protein
VLKSAGKINNTPRLRAFLTGGADTSDIADLFERASKIKSSGAIEVISQQQAVREIQLFQAEDCDGGSLPWARPMLGSRSIALQVRPRDRAPTIRVSAHAGHDRYRGRSWHAHPQQRLCSLPADLPNTRL